MVPVILETFLVSIFLVAATKKELLNVFIRVSRPFVESRMTIVPRLQELHNLFIQGPASICIIVTSTLFVLWVEEV